MVVFSPASAQDQVEEISPPIVCSDAVSVDCGPPLCLDAREKVSRRKAVLRDTREWGSASRVRKAKKRLARARRDRREACKGFV